MGQGKGTSSKEREVQRKELSLSLQRIHHLYRLTVKNYKLDSQGAQRRKYLLILAGWWRTSWRRCPGGRLGHK